MVCQQMLYKIGNYKIYMQKSLQTLSVKRVQTMKERDTVIEESNAYLCWWIHTKLTLFEEIMAIVCRKS